MFNVHNVRLAAFMGAITTLAAGVAISMPPTVTRLRCARGKYVTRSRHLVRDTLTRLSSPSFGTGGAGLPLLGR